MIIYTDTNLFLSPAQTLVNTVNTVGVMGRGIAKDFKRYYPHMFDHYRQICLAKQLDVGKLLISKEEPVLRRRQPTGEERRRWVLNFPTKRHWRAKSKLEYVEVGLVKFVDEYEHRGIKSISFPQLGVGNGGLKWPVVQEMMEHYLAPLDIPVYIHIYHSNTDHYDQDDKKAIERNLNVAHDAWRQGPAIQQAGLDRDPQVNVDGIILPGSATYERARQLAGNKELRLMDSASPAIWLQADSRMAAPEAEQLDLGI
ncbi:macro domain-containing protein [Limosilactobacillus reuteri]|uniref:macro domain-containing protein n=1 Tax=Limosilactobacillus reuteri TaxID=1598 RepID=UPI00068EA688|nr:macro domain-containing protein [Limosilactobacillus reuteri]WJK30319.1 macro domain-containing protein [Limosilactobacillus reuteri]